MIYDIEAGIFEWSGEVSARYPESGLMKEVVVNYDSWENGFDLLDTRDNGGARGLDEKIINSVGGMNVWSRFWIEIFKGLNDRFVWRVKYIEKLAKGRIWK